LQARDRLAERIDIDSRQQLSITSQLIGTHGVLVGWLKPDEELRRTLSTRAKPGQQGFGSGAFDYPNLGLCCGFDFDVHRTKSDMLLLGELLGEGVLGCCWCRYTISTATIGIQAGEFDGEIFFLRLENSLTRTRYVNWRRVAS
jgi:hypothetical protein